MCKPPRHRDHLSCVLAYVVVADALAQCPSLSQVSPAPHANDWFGHEFAWAGDWLFVSSPGDDTVAPLAGVVDAFQVTPAGIHHRQRLFPSNQSSNMLFGWSMDGEVGRIVVGGPYVAGVINGPSPGQLPPGVVYVFELFGTAWLETARLVPSNGGNGDEFGLAVAVSGDRIIVGAPYNDLVVPDGGRVYTYERSGAAWNEVHQIAATPIQGGVGSALDLDGDLAVVRGGTPLFTQVVALYRWSGTQWGYLRGFGVNESAYLGGFGEDLSLTGSRLAISAPHYAPTDGAVFYYHDAPSLASPVEVVTLPPHGGNPRLFGAQVALTEAGLVAADVPGPSAGNRPRVYRHTRAASGWTMLEEFTDAPGTYQDGYAARLEVNGGLIAVGASRNDQAGPAAGLIRVYERDSGLARACFCELVAPCGAVAADGGCINSTGEPARLYGCGSASVLSDDLTLRATGLPTLQFVLPFMGDTLEAQQILGAGRRCAGGVAKRFAPVHVGATGEVVVGPGLAAQSLAAHGAGVIAAGTTWSFQLWYRDNAQPCSNINFTNALTVQFRP